MEINKKIIKELKDCLDEFNLNEIEYSYKDTKIKVSKKQVQMLFQMTSPVILKTKYSQENKKETSGKKVTSPIIGTAYLGSRTRWKKIC